MAMLNLDAYTGRDIQHFLQMITQLDAAGVSDLRSARTIIGDYLRSMNNDMMRTDSIVSCPSCKSAVLVGPYTVDGLRIMRCANKCGYSDLLM